MSDYANYRKTWVRMMEDALAQAPLSSAKCRTLLRLAWAINEFRAINPKIASSQIVSFLVVATNPGLGPTDYAKAIGTIQPVASALLLGLGPKARSELGMGLLDRRTSDESLRNIEYTLSPTGRILAERVADIIRGRTSLSSGTPNKTVLQGVQRSDTKPAGV